MLKKYIFVLNFKMYLTHNEFKYFLCKYSEQFYELVERSKNDLIILPSHENITSALEALKNEHIKIGAQACSFHSFGPYTGQVSARSLAQLGCEYCLIGHSEERNIYSYTNQDLACKIEQCLQEGIIPIYCIGEPYEKYRQGLTIPFLEKQLAVLSLVSWNLYQKRFFLLAYEPIWAIGSAINPTREHVTLIVDYLKKFLYDNAHEAGILYGGSVNAQSIIPLQTVPNLDGFLIGKSSTDFQALKKIVLSEL